MPEADDRVPSSIQIREVYETLWAFILRGDSKSWTAWRQEDEFLPMFVNFADALRPIRPAIGRFEGWPHAVGRTFRVVVETFDAIVRDWGWERLAGSETERATFWDERNERFREEVERPLYEAALSWQAGCVGLECPPDRFAEVGRRLGFSPTLSPSEGEARFEPLRVRWLDAPRLGRESPKIRAEHKQNLGAAFNLLSDNLYSQRMSGDWRPRHVLIEAPPHFPAPRPPWAELALRRSLEEVPQGRRPASHRKRGGRPSDTDATKDRKIWEAWQSKRHASRVELGRAFGITLGEVISALDRHRKRT